jgi:hypothetical protein
MLRLAWIGAVPLLLAGLLPSSLLAQHCASCPASGCSPTPSAGTARTARMMLAPTGELQFYVPPSSRPFWVVVRLPERLPMPTAQAGQQQLEPTQTQVPDALPAQAPVVQAPVPEPAPVIVDIVYPPSQTPLAQHHFLGRFHRQHGPGVGIHIGIFAGRFRGGRGGCGSCGQ